MEWILGLFALIIGIVVFVLGAIGIAIISIADGIKGFLTKDRR